MKSRTSVRVRDRKRQQALTGNKPVKQAPLTELEERVVAIIGSNYIEGHESVAENVPMNLVSFKGLISDSVLTTFSLLGAPIGHGRR